MKTNRTSMLRCAAVLLLAGSGAAQAGAKEEVGASMRKFVAASSYHATMTTTGAFAQEEQLDELVDVELGEIGMDNVDVSALPDAAVAELHLYLTSDTQESESITQNRVRSVLEDYGVRLRTGEVYVVDPATT